MYTLIQIGIYIIGLIALYVVYAGIRTIYKKDGWLGVVTWLIVVTGMTVGLCLFVDPNHFDWPEGGF